MESRNPLDIISDTIPQLNLTVPPILLKKTTDSLIHQYYLNASICQHEGKILLAYRTDQKPVCTEPRIHLVQLNNKDLTPLPETNLTLDTHTTKQGWRVDYAGKCHRNYKNRAEDPRLVDIDGMLYIFWTNGFTMQYSRLVVSFESESESKSKLKSALLLCQHLYKPPHVPEIQKDPRYDGREKNHSPFGHNGKLHIIYSYEPFVVCQVDGNKCLEPVKYDKQLNWNYGFVKGGTPAIPLDNERYVTFFHSSMRFQLTSDPDGEKSGNYYYMGALTFSRETLEPLEISRYPIIAPYPDLDPVRTNDSYVVFPCGVVDRQTHLMISYGYNDHSIKMYALPKGDLEYNLRRLS